MSERLSHLGRPALLSLANALAGGTMSAPYAVASLAQHVRMEDAPAITAELAEMHADGMAPRHIARCLALLAEERLATQQMADRVELVWSPPELDHVDCRDTVVVVQDLFAQAKESVLIVSYAIDDGFKAQTLFGKLAQRMDANPALAVRVIANVHRKHKDQTPSAVLLAAFAKRFRDQLWPGARRPEVYHYPRSLEMEGSKHAVLHAKCVVIDGRRSLLTSANFTEAAQQRNVEVGVLVDDEKLAQRLVRQFERLVDEGVVCSVRLS